jgi:hypothetical protein
VVNPREVLVKPRISVLVAAFGVMALMSALPTNALAQRVATARGASAHVAPAHVASSRAVVVGGAAYRGPVAAGGAYYRAPVAVHGAYYGSHVHVGVGVGYYGAPFYGSWYFGYPYYGGYFGVGFGYGYGYGYPYYGYAPGPYPYAYPYYYDGSASLRVQVSPRQAEVYVDGYYAGVVDNFDGTFQRLDIQPGQHDIQLYLPGHRLMERHLYLQPGRTTSIKYAMEPLGPGEVEPAKPIARPDPDITPSTASGASGSRPRPSSPPRDYGNADRNDVAVSTPPTDRGAEGYGTLALRVQPGPANITIDGEKWDGPQDNERFVVQLPSGRHVVEVQKDGFRRYTTEVTVRSGEPAALNVALTKN